MFRSVAAASIGIDPCAKRRPHYGITQRRVPLQRAAHARAAQYAGKPVAEQQQRLVTVALPRHPQQAIGILALAAQRLGPAGSERIVPSRTGDQLIFGAP